MINLSLYDTIWLIGGAIAAGLLWGIFVSAIKRRGTPVPLESRLKAVVDAVGTVLKVHVVSLVLFESEDGHVDDVKVISGSGLAGFDPPASPFSRSKGNHEQVRQVADWMLVHRRALDVGELHRPALAAVLEEQGVRLCIPVLQEEKLAGFLCLGACRNTCG